MRTSSDGESILPRYSISDAVLFFILVLKPGQCVVVKEVDGAMPQVTLLTKQPSSTLQFQPTQTQARSASSTQVRQNAGHCTLYRPRKPSLATVLVRTSIMPMYFTGLPQ